MALEFNHDLQKASHLDALAGKNEAYVAVTHSSSPIATGSVDIFTIKDKSGSVEMEKMQTLKVPGALASNFGELTKYDVGLFIQTEHGVHVYVLKGMQFVYERMVKTVPARKPFSFPFYHTGQNTTFLLYAGNDVEGGQLGGKQELMKQSTGDRRSGGTTRESFGAPKHNHTYSEYLKFRAGAADREFGGSFGNRTAFK
ncbi:uncharacterized protein LOC119578454 [Penaeus monodon]|uniref:uncharacterized protein LOC119578454 n=1 Tax=Penaeus monodon TaxID=6687 RepID=UPI0018A71971|nr:uncharacterized protein LOC119578454 [Penaeus monodon]